MCLGLGGGGGGMSFVAEVDIPPLGGRCDVWSPAPWGRCDG